MDDNLSEEEKKILSEMNSNWEKVKQDEKLFWDKEYPDFSFEDKIKYWASENQRLMRWQAESGLDEYDIFSPQWYKWAKEKEPEIDKIMDIAFEKYLSWEWSKEEYLKRIGKL